MRGGELGGGGRADNMLSFCLPFFSGQVTMAILVAVVIDIVAVEFRYV